MSEERLRPHTDGECVFVVSFCSLIMDSHVRISNRERKREDTDFADTSTERSDKRSRNRVERISFLLTLTTRLCFAHVESNGLMKSIVFGFMNCSDGA